MLFFYECKSTSYFLNISIVLAVCSKHKLSTESWLETAHVHMTAVFIVGPFSRPIPWEIPNVKSSPREEFYFSARCMFVDSQQSGSWERQGLLLCQVRKEQRIMISLTHCWWSLNPHLHLHLPEIPGSWGGLQCKLSFHEFSSLTVEDCFSLVC